MAFQKVLTIGLFVSPVVIIIVIILGIYYKNYLESLYNHAIIYVIRKRELFLLISYLENCYKLFYWEGLCKREI